MENLPAALAGLVGMAAIEGSLFNRSINNYLFGNKERPNKSSSSPLSCLVIAIPPLVDAIISLKYPEVGWITLGIVAVATLAHFGKRD